MTSIEAGYDYVIVGAGSAGCTLAARLTEDPDVRVLLIEAGGWDRDPRLTVPLAWGQVYSRKLYDWRFPTEPEAALGGRSVECARGKVVGGSSSINAMAYVRGNHADYDRWAAAGLPSWSHAAVLPYFLRQESWEGGASAFRGGDGPLSTREARYQDPLVEASIAAGVEAGLPLTDDYNGAQQEGLGRIQSTIRHGRRCSASVAYLRPALARRNLTVVVRALVLRVLLEGDRAVGVAYAKGGSVTQVLVAREVILAGGVINSPQLLMLSGIGDPAALRRHGIAVRVASPGVGRNLQDHVSPIVRFRRREPGPLFHRMRYDRIAADVARAYLFGSGMASDMPCGLVGFLRSDSSQAIPDLQLLLNAAPLTASPYLHPRLGAYPDGFAFRVILLRPSSRGSVTLASADPRAAPRIHQNFLTDVREWAVLRAGLRLVRDIGLRGALRPFSGGEIDPPEADSDAALDDFIRVRALTTHHPAGTCRMGGKGDALAVVDEELRVVGVRGLRVVDASVMPDLVGGNINAPVIMIAEKAADLLRGRAPLPAMLVPTVAQQAASSAPAHA